MDRPIWLRPLLGAGLLGSALMLYTQVRVNKQISTPDGFQRLCGKADSVTALPDGEVLFYGHANIGVVFRGGEPEYWRGGFRFTQHTAAKLIGCGLPD